MRSLLALLLLSLPYPAILSAQDVSPMVFIEVRTELGDFRMELYPQKAPNTVANFLRYVGGWTGSVPSAWSGPTRQD